MNELIRENTHNSFLVLMPMPLLPPAGSDKDGDAKYVSRVDALTKELPRTVLIASGERGPTFSLDI